MPAGQHRLFHSGLFRVETSPACFFSPATLSSLLSSPLLRRGSSRDIAAHACRNDPLWCCFSSVPMLITALLGSLAGTPSVRVSFPMLFHFFFIFYRRTLCSLDYRECKDEGRRFMAVVGRGCWSLLIGDGGGGGGGRWTRGGGWWTCNCGVDEDDILVARCLGIRVKWFFRWRLFFFFFMRASYVFQIACYYRIIRISGIRETFVVSK